MTIISASRRTDIPAFYSDWLMHRIQDGVVRWTNPFNGAICEVSLRPEDVSAFVFLSKNYQPLLPHLPELEKKGYGMVFLFTITGLPSIFEPSVPPAELTIQTAKKLASRYNAEAVLWRYDPILISSMTSPEYHRKRFKELASALEGVTHRCYFSFPTFYGKVIRNLGALRQQHGITCQDLSQESKLELANQLAEMAAEYGIDLYTCCNESLVGGRIQKAHCVDGPLLQTLFPDRVGQLKLNPTRKECGCYESKDIGIYNTCPHGCVYCYANTSPEAAQLQYQKHCKDADMLTRDSGIEHILKKKASQLSFGD